MKTTWLFELKLACKTLDIAIKCGYVHNIKQLKKSSDEDEEEMDITEAAVIDRALALKKLQYECERMEKSKQARQFNSTQLQRIAPKDRSLVLKKLQYQSAHKKDQRLNSMQMKNQPQINQPLVGKEIGLCGDMNEVDQTVKDVGDVTTVGEGESDNRCSRLELLLNPLQMITEQLPVPGLEQCQNFLPTSIKYEPVNEKSPMFSIDCEWVLCKGGKWATITKETKDLDTTFFNEYFISRRQGFSTCCRRQRTSRVRVPHTSQAHSSRLQL